MIHGAVAVVATIFDRLGRHEPAATIAGFVVSSPLAALPVMAEFGTAIAHLRNVLGEATYEWLARDHRSDCDVRIRPNRPAPSRTEWRLEIDHIQDSPGASETLTG